MQGIKIHSIHVDCHVGPEPEERAHPQRIAFTLFLEVDLTAAGKDDEMSLTVDYRGATDLVVSTASSSPFRTLEGLAYAAGRAILEQYALVSSLSITVAKPGVPGRAQRVTITLQLEREHTIGRNPAFPAA